MPQSFISANAVHSESEQTKLVSTIGQVFTINKNILLSMPYVCMFFACEKKLSPSLNKDGEIFYTTKGND